MSGHLVVGRGEAGVGPGAAVARSRVRSSTSPAFYVPQLGEAGLKLALPLAPIHRSAWKVNSANFALEAPSIGG
jgi:hypothetical protein